MDRALAAKVEGALFSLRIFKSRQTPVRLP
jgi:hypothetical protein